MEFYAKITFVNKGMYRCCATVWKSDNGIDSIWKVKKFIRSESAYRWASKNIVKQVFEQSDSLFIKEQDIIRRKWNDQ
jgi:hypothetical protein